MTKVAVVGATGYSGGELTAILARHHGAEIVALFSSTNGARVPIRELHPSLASSASDLFAEPFDIEKLVAAGPEIVFLATPNEVSAHLAPELLDLGMKVIDLSVAFRLTEPSLYPSWYQFEHERPALLGEAVYGLTEWCNGELKDARLVANPGCYPTSILLALPPPTHILDRDPPVTCDPQCA